MEFYNYTIAESTTAAYLEYRYKNTIIMFYIDKQNEYTASDIYSMNGDDVEKIVSGDDKTEVIINKVYDEMEEPSYTASWSKDDVIYVLSGRIDIEEMKKIVEYMKF